MATLTAPPAPPQTHSAMGSELAKRQQRLGPREPLSACTDQNTASGKTHPSTGKVDRDVQNAAAFLQACSTHGTASLQKGEFEWRQQFDRSKK